MIDTQPLSSRAGRGAAVAAARITWLLRDSHDWRQVIDGVLEELGRALDCHRTILFRLQDMPGEGMKQSVSAFWVDEHMDFEVRPPTVIEQAVVNADPLLDRLGRELRQGKVFAGHTRELEGFLRGDFERQQIRSFLSVPVFAFRNVWGNLAVNDCAVERDWRDDERACVEIVAIAISDAVERALSDEHISESIRFTMLQMAFDAIIVIDQTGSIVEFNPAAEAMFGWKRPEILGQDILHTIIPDHYRGSYATGGEYLAGRGAPMVGQRVETTAQDRWGRVFPIEITVTEMPVADRKFFIGSIRDLSERRRAEAEINRQRERLHQNEKMAAMGSLLAGVSHELNNPLAVVVAQSTLLHEFATDPQTKARAEKVRAAAERCGRIVKSFLGMVRLQPTTQTETNLNQVVRSALEITAYGARSSGISVETELAEGPLAAMVDADQMTQVAANLLINSQHALMAQPGERRIRVRTFRDGADCGFLVEDNGPGIAEELRQRIFESYFTTKAVGVGTGIGLSISRSIVERHGGLLWFEPVEPNGARFVVRLPAHLSASAEQSVGGGLRRGIRRALIIDDEPDVAGSLADMLQLMGLETRVLTAWTSAEAELASFEPDVVFSDLRMPGAGGLAIYRDLLAVRESFAHRFVLVTGDMLGAKAEVEALPPHLRPQLLEKPFTILDARGVIAAIADQVALAT